MKGLLHALLFVVGLLMAPAAALGQHHVVMQNGYLQTCDGTIYPMGTIVDDGDSTGNYSNGFYGEVAITAPIGDTIVVWGNYNVESNYDNIYVFHDAAATVATST